jgi:predicted dehydrogenase
VPADLHIPVARKAIDAGLHTLIEKPLAVALDGVSELESAVDRSALVAGVGYVYRAHRALAAMKVALDSGEFGRPVQVVVVAGQNFPTYRSGYRESYYAVVARGGGAIQDAMTHLVNAAEWLVGPIRRVVADADHQLIPGVEVEDVVNFLARHDNVIASYSLNQYQSPNEVTITVVCEQGTARFEYHRNRWRDMRRPDESWHDEPVAGLERDTLFIRQAEAFLDAIEGRGSPLCDLKDAVQTLGVNLALRKSVESGCWEAVRTPKRDHCVERS